jgi:hypothetical protein
LIRILQKLISVGGKHLLRNVIDGFQNERAIKRARAEAEIELEKRRQLAEVDWNVVMASKSDKTFVDEMWSIAILLFFVACFMPWTQDSVREGLRMLTEDVDDWVAVILVAAPTAAFSLQQVFHKALQFRAAGRAKREGTGL